MILYHYCSTDTFLKIISSRSIWLSMLDMSNDRLEGKWIETILEREIASRSVLSSNKELVMDSVRGATRFLFAAGFCLSEEPDQLSQWRGYADDGFGFAIGFRREYFEALGSWYRDNREVGFGLTKVLYDETQYKNELDKILAGVEAALDDGALAHRSLLILAEDDGSKAKREKASRRLISTLAPLMILCHHIKNPAFKEENEWRLLSMVTQRNPEFKIAIDRLCDFRGPRDRLVPYRSVVFQDLGIAPIGKIVTGPRNISRKEYIDALLARHGFEDFEIERSSASYR